MIVPPDAAATGLSDLAVQTRVDAGQVNTVLPAPGRSLGQILRANVLTRFNAILGSLFVVVLVVGPPQDALFGAVLVVNTGIGVAQELRAKRALDRLAILTAGRARAVRDGTVTEIALDRIVLDDVLELARGDQVPVDGTVLSDDGLELDEALLTGEAKPVRKEPGDTIMSGSFVVAGTGRIRAVGVGAHAYAARLQAQARRFSLIRSELQQGTNQILRLVTWVMVPAGLLLILSEFFRSHDPLRDAARGSAAGVVAMVPEGLVLLTSLAFAAGALRLARHRVLVQELAAIEGLARAGVLCNDKTGTLTKPGLRLIETEVVSGRPGAQIAEVIGALAAVDEAPNETGRSLAAHYQAAATCLRARSSARCLMPSSILRSMIRLPGSMTSMLNRRAGSAPGAAIRFRLISLVRPSSAKSAKIHTQFPSANRIVNVRSGSKTATRMGGRPGPSGNSSPALTSWNCGRIRRALCMFRPNRFSIQS